MGKLYKMAGIVINIMDMICIKIVFFSFLFLWELITIFV